MKVYHLKRSQFLPITLSAAWEFFSSPTNLARITPKYMGFEILYMSGGGDNVYAGQIIQYHVNVLPGIKVNWVTEITHLQKPLHFIDEQRVGPYSLWHHQHHFKEADGGVEMTDVVNYAIPLGWLGQLVHWIFVGREVNRIFTHRFHVLDKYFNDNGNGFLKVV